MAVTTTEMVGATMLDKVLISVIIMPFMHITDATGIPVYVIDQ